ncbi:polysaccharide deacetylase family protein [Actinoplanes sp. NPDC049668]|uniref:polysaccharide deacetylase family protein n=1 Tax=unclassified Actinoplanes TaxID=2626549 RepID=UPI0033BA9F23
MPPHPPSRSEPKSGPRHAARTASRARSGDALTATTGGFPHVQVLEGETARGRHRRPESLADATVLRPPASIRIAGGRRVALALAPRGATVDSPTRSASSAPRRSAGGRHAKAADPLAITVRPLPVVLDAAGAVRDWALADTGRRPVTGTHRAPGTLPIESWLLVGRRRQQALLASLVAIGLMLIVVPMQQGGGVDINPVNAAGQAIVKAPKAPKKKEKPAGQSDRAEQAGAPAGPSSPAPAGTEGAKPAPAKSAAGATAGAPAILVPNGTGPAKSLRTTGTAAVALTFDDGPDPVQTPKILELLAKYQVKATFCLVGDQVRKYPDLVRQIAVAGHTLCNHTWNHSFTIGKDKRGKIRADLRRTNDAIHAAVPGAAIPFFRAPGGNFTDALVETAYQDGMTSLYWEVDPRDWEHLEKDDDAAHIDKIVKSVQNEVRPGSIVLSHDFNQPDTIRAYDELLPWLVDRFELGLPSEPKPPAEQPAAEPPAAEAPPAEAPAAAPAAQPASDA